MPEEPNQPETEPGVEFVAAVYIPISERTPIEKPLIVYVPRLRMWVEAIKYSPEGAWFTDGFKPVKPSHWCDLKPPKGMG